jgi:predicted Zn-ribbon and HTH transcriptional regulator
MTEDNPLLIDNPTIQIKGDTNLILPRMGRQLLNNFRCKDCKYKRESVITYKKEITCPACGSRKIKYRKEKRR